MARLPANPGALRQMAMRQAQELFDLGTRLDAAKSGRMKYASMKTSQLRRKAMRPSGGVMAEGQKPKRSATAQGDRNQKGSSKPRLALRGQAPSDPQLNTLLRAFVRKTNSEKVTKGIFQNIQKRSRESDDLRRQTVSMFHLLVSGNRAYGTNDAQSLATQFLEQNGSR